MVSTSFATTSGFRAAYRAHYGFIWAAMQRLGVSAGHIEDAVQDTFIVAYRRRETFRPGAPRPWLYGIARGVASNYRRTARRVSRKQDALASAATLSAPPHPDPHASVQAVDRFLNALPALDRELFVLSELEGLTGPELTLALQVNLRTIYRRLHRLRQRFAQEAIDDESAAPVRPRAAVLGWVARLSTLRATRPGWIGWSAGPKLAAVAVGLAIAASVGLDPGSPPPRPSNPAEPSHAAVEGPSAARLDPRPRPPSRSIPTFTPQPPTATGSTSSPGQTPLANGPRRSAEPPRRPAGPATSPSGAEAPPSPALSLERENTLLRRASKAAGAGNHADALEATRRHAAEFPDSPLSNLRTALRIESLCGLGKERQARGEAHAFVSTHPQAPMVARIERACVSNSRRAGQ